MITYPHLTEANLSWLFRVAYPTAEKGSVTPQSLQILNRARALILNKPESTTDCFSCSARAESRVSISVLEQHKPNLLVYQEHLKSVQSSVKNVIETDVPTHYHVEEEVITNPTQNLDNDVIVEKIVSIESTENEINVKTIKRKK